MSPRRNRPARPARGRDGPGGRGGRGGAAPLDPERLRRGVDAVETWAGEQWRVRQIPGSGATKLYRCPGCQQEVRPGVAHLVVWPVEPLAGPGEAQRRHWHTGCWRARDRRRPA